MARTAGRPQDVAQNEMTPLSCYVSCCLLHCNTGASLDRNINVWRHSQHMLPRSWALRNVLHMFRSLRPSRTYSCVCACRHPPALRCKGNIAPSAITPTPRGKGRKAPRGRGCSKDWVLLQPWWNRRCSPPRCTRVQENRVERAE